jgi:hypothetical protein
LTDFKGLIPNVLSRNWSAAAEAVNGSEWCKGSRVACRNDVAALAAGCPDDSSWE